MTYTHVMTGGVSVSGHAWCETDKATVRIDEALRWFLANNLTGDFWKQPGRIQQGRTIQGTVSPRIVYRRENGDELLFMNRKSGVEHNDFILAVVSKNLHQVQNIIIELRALLNNYLGNWKNHLIQFVEVLEWSDDYTDMGTFADLGLHVGQVTVRIQSEED